MRTHNSIKGREGQLHRDGDIWGGSGKTDRSLSLGIERVEEHEGKTGKCEEGGAQSMFIR